MKILIKEIMNMLLTSRGRTFVWNPRSKFQVRRKIKDVRLTFGDNVELTFFHPLPSKTSKLFTVKPTVDCLESFSVVD
jgi:hypothetical protein|tara:strand:- start:129 stop:362 length:234 start_codon:yes stop_codon:yes gene_type:complete